MSGQGCIPTGFVENTGAKSGMRIEPIVDDREWRLDMPHMDYRKADTLSDEY